jgi:carbamoyl-phosphate synthase large subunit
VVGKDGAVDREELLIRLGEPRPDRLLAVAQALRYGAGLEEIATATRIDPWFLRQIADLVAAEEQLRRHGLPDDGFQLRRLKRLGFCDARLAELTGPPPSSLRSRPTSIPPTRPVTPRPAAIQSSLARPGPANGTR